MAKNTGGFTRISNVEDNAEKEFLKGADMRKSSALHSNAGRKGREVKTDKSKRVYFTEEQEEKVDQYCAKARIDFSPLIRQLLIKEGIL